jgi:CDP-paratose 2-epimerase
MKTLITGGAGFIGSNLADRLLSMGRQVSLYDNLSRAGCKRNVRWLREKYGTKALNLTIADVRETSFLRKAVKQADIVYHLAAQTAVTNSVRDPRTDFEINALGTLNVLEEAVKFGDDPIIIYASTNKVYGSLASLRVFEFDTRYSCGEDWPGIAETQPLDFHSPYGCSKGCGDQYTRDYARIYSLRTVVCRQSCIYGPRQLGTEDQGWAAWFMRAALRNKPVVIYGDGKQVRDMLYVDDLIDAYLAIERHIDVAAGQVYNLGGGPENTISVWAEFAPLLEELAGRRPPVDRFSGWRPGDQKIYVSDIRKAEKELGWRPKTGVRAGLTGLCKWMKEEMAVST